MAGNSNVSACSRASLTSPKALITSEIEVELFFRHFLKQLDYFRISAIIAGMFNEIVFFSRKIDAFEHLRYFLNLQPCHGRIPHFQPKNEKSQRPTASK